MGEVEKLKSRMKNVKVGPLAKAAKVGRATIWRLSKGNAASSVTLDKLNAALDEMGVARVGS